jgi:hypothetical protein
MSEQPKELTLEQRVSILERSVAETRISTVKIADQIEHTVLPSLQDFNSRFENLMPQLQSSFEKQTLTVKEYIDQKFGGAPGQSKPGEKRLQIGGVDISSQIQKTIDTFTNRLLGGEQQADPVTSQFYQAQQGILRKLNLWHTNSMQKMLMRLEKGDASAVAEIMEAAEPELRH